MRLSSKHRTIMEPLEQILSVLGYKYKRIILQEYKKLRRLLKRREYSKKGSQEPVGALPRERKAIRGPVAKLG